MLAQRADNIIRQSISLIDIAAYLAHKALLAICLRLRLYIVLLIGVGHGLPIAHHPCFCYGADKHTVSIQIHILIYL